MEGICTRRLSGACTPGGWVLVGALHSTLGYCHLLLCVSYKSTSPRVSWEPLLQGSCGPLRRITSGMLHQIISLITVGGLGAITDTRNLSVIIYLAPSFSDLSRPRCCDPNPHSRKGLSFCHHAVLRMKLLCLLMHAC